MYKRVLLKLSGEALKGHYTALDPEKLEKVTDDIVDLYEEKVQIAIVIGGGNISRGSLGERWGIAPVDSDINGILATLVNAGWIASILETKLGNENVVKMVTVPSSYVGEMYSPKKARSQLEKNRVLVIGGGSGISLCTTDAAAVQRAIELNVEAVIMLKNAVDGVFDQNPKVHPEARMYRTISFTDFKKMEAEIADETSAILASKYEMPMHFVNFDEPGVMSRVCKGENAGTLVGDVITQYA